MNIQETTLQEERNKTIMNVSTDIFKIEKALNNIEDLTPEGKIIREDLIGLLYFESDEYHQIDQLMIERRKEEKINTVESEETIKILQ